MLQIKSATLADVPTIRALCREVWPQTYDPIIGPQQVAYMLTLFYSPESLEYQMTTQQHKFVICCCNDEPVAFAAYSITGPQIVKLHKLYVLPGMQGKGIGKYMMDAIADDARSWNAVAVRLNVNRYNLSARAFYERSGFDIFSEEDIDIGNGYFMNDYVMEKRLDQ